MLKQSMHIALLSTSIMMVLATPAYAYLDPGTGSMILQMLAAGIAGAIVVGKLYWHKLLVMFGFRKELPSDEDHHSPHTSNEQ